MRVIAKQFGVDPGTVQRISRTYDTRAERRFVSQFAKSLFYFRRRRPDRHGRTRDFAGTRRRVDADDRPRLDVDRDDRTGLDDRRRLNIEGMRSGLDTGGAGGYCVWRGQRDIRLW